MDKVGFLCNSITINKALSIKNQRLGLVFRILQIAAVVLVLIQIAVSRAWNSQTLPVSYGLEMWTTSGSVAAKTNSAVVHCNDSLALQYVYNENTTYGPTSCKRLPPGENYNKNGPSLFFPIFVMDTYVHGYDPMAPKTCADVVCGPKQTKVETVDTCECQEKDDFFVKNPEENVLVINHGFAVNKVNMFGGKEKTVGRSVMEDEENEILTIVTLKGDRDTKCQIGGRLEWPLSVSKQGIQGPLKDWMACGGVHLDDPVPTSRSWMKGETKAPVARILGLNMQISLIYTNSHNEDFDGAVCYIEVIALPLWNSHTAIAFTQVPDLYNATSSFRNRYQFGISISLQSSGNFLWFDLNALILVITSSLVLLALPGTVVQFLATTCVGRVSTIYAAVATESFSIVESFHGLCARLLGHKMSYEALTAGKGKSTLKQEALLDNLKEVMEEEITAGTLQDAELEKMAFFLMDQMDTAGNDCVGLQEFLHASNNNEAIKMTDLSSFFDDDFKPGIFEKIFSDVASGIKGKAQKKPDSKVAPEQQQPQVTQVTPFTAPTSSS